MVPNPLDDPDQTRELIGLGERLLDIHLVSRWPHSTHRVQGTGSWVIRNPHYTDKRIWLNTDKWIDCERSVWDMYFGRNRPVKQWLLKREGTKISDDEAVHLTDLIDATRTLGIARREGYGWSPDTDDTDS